MFFLLPLLGVAAFVYLVNWFFQKRRQDRLAKEWGCQLPARRQPRWPMGLDFVVELLHADKTFDIPNYFSDVWKGVGANTWWNNVLGTQVLATNEPENIKAMLATQFDEFALPDQRQQIFHGIFGNGIFTDNGKRWEHSRALLRPQFTRDNIADLVAQERHVQNIMKFLEPGPDGWSPQTDLSPIFFRLTLDSATEFLFGQDVGSQVAAFSESHKTSTDADLDWVQFGFAFTMGMKCMATKFRLQDWHWLYRPPKYYAAMKEIHRFADHFVERALEYHRSGAKSVEDGSRRYVFAYELAEATQDPRELRNQLLHILLAGRDTTSGMLGWLFYTLGQHPDVYAKLRDAVLNDFGPYDNPRNMDFAGLKACTYLQRVMNEILRLFPIVPFNSRMCTRDTTLPLGGGPDQKSPVFVPKGTEVNYGVHFMHAREDLWGKDAHEFRPDRWEGRKYGWEYLPFNGGPRICLGQQYALTTAGYTICRLIQRFDRIGDLVDHGPRLKHYYDVTTSPLTCSLRFHVAAGDGDGGGEKA